MKYLVLLLSLVCSSTTFSTFTKEELEEIEKKACGQPIHQLPQMSCDSSPFYARSYVRNQATQITTPVAIEEPQEIFKHVKGIIAETDMDGFEEHLKKNKLKAKGDVTFGFPDELIEQARKDPEKLSYLQQALWHHKKDAVRSMIFSWDLFYSLDDDNTKKLCCIGQKTSFEDVFKVLMKDYGGGFYGYKEKLLYWYEEAHNNPKYTPWLNK